MHKRNPQQPVQGVSDLVPQLLTVQQVAATLNVGASTVYKLIREDGLPYVQVNKCKRVPVASLRWWISQHEQSSSNDVETYLREKAARMHEPAPAVEPIQLATRAPRKHRAAEKGQHRTDV
jgi:excisionase family DNA binding protein